MTASVGSPAGPVRSVPRRRVPIRRALVCMALASVLVVLGAAGLLLGDFPLPAGDVLAVLIGGGDAGSRFVIVDLRLPRIVLALAVGVALAVAGGVFQTVLRNPLASPDLLGVTWGAVVAAVYAQLVLGLPGLAVSGAAVAGGVATALVIAWAAAGGGIGGRRLVLVGVGVAFMAQSALGYVLTRAEVRDAQTAFVWMVGGVGDTSWTEIRLLGAGLALVLPALLLLSRATAVLELGDDLARGLGMRARAARACLLLGAVVLASLATAAAGAVSFVALMSAPIARRLVGGGSAALVPAALVGAVLVLGADMIAQHAVPGATVVPAGVVTGAIGAPYLLLLLIRGGR